MSREKQLRRFQQLEDERADLLDDLSGIDPERLSRTPKDGGWSPLQVVAHLVQAEGLSLAYIRKKLPGASEAPRAGLMGKGRIALLFVVLRSGIRVKAPAVVAKAPETTDLETVVAEWEVVRSGWRDLIDELDEELWDRAVYRHPIAGRLNLGQALTFCREHQRHHRPQIRRALAEG